jgi:hypothetical protein
MLDPFYFLLVLTTLAVAVGAFVWAVRWLYFGFRFRQFTKQTEELHHLAYLAETEESRRQARRKFGELVEAAVKSKNGHINNRNTAKVLKGYIDYAVYISAAGEQSDAGEIASWGERVTEILQPMFYRPNIK